MSEDQPTPDFGMPLSLDALLELVEIDIDDFDGASDWFDEHVSDFLLGAIEP